MQNMLKGPKYEVKIVEETKVCIETLGGVNLNPRLRTWRNRW